LGFKERANHRFSNQSEEKKVDPNQIFDIFPLNIEAKKTTKRIAVSHLVVNFIRSKRKQIRNPPIFLVH
jgi:hypothetical protein